ncbi:MAG: hypothetical protein WAN14_12525 [Candidatus Acidiferrales bacterium]
MKGSVEYAFVARELVVRVGRHLVVLTLPLVCWLAGQDCFAQALLTWVAQRGMTQLAAARARENFYTSPVPEDTLDGINQIHSMKR